MKVRSVAIIVTLLAACGGLVASVAPRSLVSAELPATVTAAVTPSAPETRPVGWALWNTLRGDPYELDDVERQIEGESAKVSCRPEAMASYTGTRLRYSGAVAIAPAFRERLQRFEEVVAETALEVYGRAPRRIRHYGAFSCRSSRNREYRLSEHALGNAIDVVGFDFGPATKQEVLATSLPKQLRWAFEVRVARHWNAETGSTAPVHARFLRLLIERLQERGNVFRGLITPGHPGHHDHFHFDMSPWRYVRP